jgi:hypothetical protein
MKVELEPGRRVRVGVSVSYNGSHFKTGNRSLKLHF